MKTYTLIGNMIDGYNISDADVKSIKKLNGTELVKLSPQHLLREFATGLFGDLHYNSNGVYTAKELKDWFKELE
jgi:hypothetical protein